MRLSSTFFHNSSILGFHLAAKCLYDGMTNQSHTTKLLYGCFDGLRGLEIAMTLQQAHDCSHMGDCEDDCRHLANEAAICDQLDALGNEQIAEGLKESGAWNTEELEDYRQNRVRAIWLAACEIKENFEG